MITIKSILKKNLPVIVLAIILFLITSMSIQWVIASSGFKDNEVRWRNLEEGLDKQEDVYPYNSSTAQINIVSLDVAYGVTRGLVSFHGEAPAEQTCQGEYTGIDVDKRVDSWQGTPIADYKYTTLKPSRTRPDGKVDTAPNAYWGTYGSYLCDIPTLDYWGIQLGTAPLESADVNANEIAKNELEQVNHKDKGVVSLRLYALEQTYEHGWYHYITQFFYFLTRLLAQGAMLIIKLIIDIKNIEPSEILGVFGFEDLFKKMTESFIENENGGLSPLTVFAIVTFMIIIVAYVIKWVKGAQKTRALWSDILIYTAMGLLIIGVCLTGRANSLATTLSNATTKVLYAITDSMNDGDLAFNLNVSDPMHDNKIVCLREMTAVNKAFMNIQIEMQFNVSSMKQLDFDELGIGSIENSHAGQGNIPLLTSSDSTTFVSSGVNGEKISADQFNNNLGYYFWAANSGGLSMSYLNKTYPDISTYAPYPKMDSMMTTLQIAYNNGTDAQKENIRRLVVGLANPQVLYGQFKMILFTIILVMLALCIWKYALAVLGNQILLLLSIAGLTVAGPLMLTSNKKLVNYGKAILGLMLISIIKISVFAAVFDLILFLVSQIIGSDIINMAITLIVLILLRKFANVLKEKLDRLLERLENNMRFTQPLRAARRSISSSIRGGRKRIVNKSKNLKAIRESSNPILAKLGARTSNMLSGTDEAKEESTLSILKNHKIKKSADEAEKRQETLDQEKQALQIKNDEIDQEASKLHADISAEIKVRTESVITINSDNHIETVDTSQLVDSEKALLSKKHKAEQKSKAITDDEQYKALLHKEMNGENMTEEEAKIFDELSRSLMTFNEEANRAESSLVQSINKRMETAVRQEMGITDTTENLEEAIHNQVRAEHKEELLTQIDRVENAARAQADTHIHDGKFHLIHKHADVDVNKINEILGTHYDFKDQSEAIMDMAFARQQREEVTQNKQMSTNRDKEMGVNYRNAAVVMSNVLNGRKVSKNLVDENGNATGFNAEAISQARTQVANSAAAVQTAGSKAERKAAKQKLKKDTETYKQALESAKKQEKDLKKQINDTDHVVIENDSKAAVDAVKNRPRKGILKKTRTAVDVAKTEYFNDQFRNINDSKTSDRFDAFISTQKGAGRAVGTKKEVEERQTKKQEDAENRQKMRRKQQEEANYKKAAEQVINEQSSEMAKEVARRAKAEAEQQRKERIKARKDKLTNNKND